MNSAGKFDGDWIEGVLSRPFEDLADDGFSRRVLMQLRWRRVYRVSILAAAGSVGMALSLWLFPPGQLVDVMAYLGGAIGALPAGGTVLLAAVSGVLLFFAAETA